MAPVDAASRYGAVWYWVRTASHASRVRELLAAWREGRDLVEIGAYKAGTNPRLDLALRFKPAFDALLRLSPTI